MDGERRDDYGWFLRLFVSSNDSFRKGVRTVSVSGSQTRCFLEGASTLQLRGEFVQFAAEIIQNAAIPRDKIPLNTTCHLVSNNLETCDTPAF